MVKFPRPLLLLLGALALVPLAGCARGNRGDTAYVARDVATLYAAAKRAMDIGDHEVAAKLFDEVERQHPYSIWARRAQLMSAFSYYMAQQYPDAVSSAQRFLTQAPWLAVFPGLAIFLVVLAFNLMGDGLRDALDPRSERK